MIVAITSIRAMRGTARWQTRFNWGCSNEESPHSLPAWTDESRADTAAGLQVPDAAQRRRRRHLWRHEGAGSLPLDGRPERARGQTVDRGRERDHVQVSRLAADPQCAQD